MQSLWDPNMVTHLSILSKKVTVREVCIPHILIEVNLEVEPISPKQRVTKTCNWRLTS